MIICFLYYYLVVLKTLDFEWFNAMRASGCLEKEPFVYSSEQVYNCFLKKAKFVYEPSTFVFKTKELQFLCVYECLNHEKTFMTCAKALFLCSFKSLQSVFFCILSFKI
jgi:hypothetical protein